MTEHNGRPITSADLMKVLLRNYFSAKPALFVPDKYKDTEGFQELFAKWRSWSVMCPEERHLDAQQGRSIAPLTPDIAATASASTLRTQHKERGWHE